MLTPDISESEENGLRGFLNTEYLKLTELILLREAEITNPIFTGVSADLQWTEENLRFRACNNKSLCQFK